MEARLHSTGSESSESIQMSGGTAGGKYHRLLSRREVKFCEKLKYPILAVLVVLALVLSIVNMSVQSWGHLRGQQQQPLQSVAAAPATPQRQVADLGSIYCGGSEDFKVLMNAYTTEGIVGTPNSRLLTNISGYRECYKQCFNVYGTGCNLFSFHDEGGTCSISSADFHSTWTLTESIDGAFSCYRYKFRSDDWKIMYRRPKLTKSGYTNEVTGPWIDNSYYTNESLHSAAAALPDSVSWSILKNSLSRFWESLNIDKVKVSLYKDGKEVHHLIFNGRGSNVESWFNDAFLLETTWTDLSPANPPMYLGWWWKGETSMHTCRAMYVVSAHPGCSNDRMWLTLVQNQVDSVCSWEQIGEQNVPRIFYAPGDTEANAIDLAEADYMVISVKFPLSLS